MSDQNDYHADPNHEDLFEREMRGYSRRRVEEFVAKTRSQIRDLEDRLSQTLDATEQLRNELLAAQQAAAEKPAHEEISERIGQILKLADDESKAQRNRGRRGNRQDARGRPAGHGQAARGGQGRHRQDPGRGARAGRADAERGAGAG